MQSRCESQKYRGKTRYLMTVYRHVHDVQITRESPNYRLM